jgi:DnaK suppressor protein
MSDKKPSPAAGQPRTDLDLDYFRKRLMEEKASAEATIAGIESADNEGLHVTGTDADDARGLNAVGTQRAELSNYDQHQGDQGSELQLREQDQVLIGNARDILRRIERALQKLDEGTYGLSDRSGKPIPVERLEAIPYAVLTVEEQG